ncbi:MAG: molybdenum cofactor guanylyltransferase [Desulfohalobiaceae bacterium]|nr:molybdenum cofactor guanylyltransferase [Desulfohalobiaceae bacterium]
MPHKVTHSIRFTAIILCGGAGSRLGGRNKAFLRLGSQCFLDHLLETLNPLVEEVQLVARDPETFSGLGIKTVTDIYSARCALTGIHAGLTHCPTTHAFITACDAPLLRPSLVRGLMQQAGPETDAVVPEYNGYLEPLCAVYSRRCLPSVESLLDQGTLRIHKLYPLINTRKVGKDFLLSLDPELTSFVNVNTEQDLRELETRQGVV